MVYRSIRSTRARDQGYCWQDRKAEITFCISHGQATHTMDRPPCPVGSWPMTRAACSSWRCSTRRRTASMVEYGGRAEGLQPTRRETSMRRLRTGPLTQTLAEVTTVKAY